MPETKDELIPTRWSLLDRLKDLDDQESWRDFFDTYRSLIYSVALKSGLTDAEADDVVQETVISVAKKMATGSADGTICLWNLANQASTLLPTEPARPGLRMIHALVFSPDGKSLASAGADGAVNLWDVRAKRKLCDPLI